MLIDLKDKVAIVTGAGRGIGREIARTLGAEGVKVVALDFKPELLAEVAAEWSEKGYAGIQVEADIRHKDDCQRAVAEAVKQFGRVDILVNNAGVASGDRVESLKEEIWDANFDSNLKGTFLMCQAVVPQMKLQNWGRIINAASFAAIIPSIGSAAYASSKAGVESFTRVLASEMGPYGVTVNCYSPGMIPTLMNRYADASPERKEQLLDTLTLRRWGSPDDVANLICFLASDLAGYITGTMIDISGGKFATQMPWMAHRN
jgi:3-oxoacyl-[acyl-carrier protein] reductase